jgi:hypothetical protein
MREAEAAPRGRREPIRLVLRAPSPVLSFPPPIPLLAARDLFDSRLLSGEKKNEAMKAAADGACGTEHHSRLIRELCALLVTILSPSSAQLAPGTPSPAAAASMLLGASMALMLCGSVTFAIGLLLVPWVLGLALLFGLAGAVSTLSSGVFGRAAALPSPSCAGEAGSSSARR